MTTPKKRPAHRPSRRDAVVEAAMRLFAQPSGDTVTVAEIADAAGMTSAAVYYHFASKDDILVEGLRAVGAALVDKTRELTDRIASGGTSVGALPVGLLAWFDERHDDATVWFVTSYGVSLAVEQLRREVRGQLLQLLTRAGKAARPDLSVAESAVVGTALLALIETAASEYLTEDESLQGLGRRKFKEETALLAERITGVRERATAS